MENHLPELSTEKEQRVWNVFQAHMSLIATPAPALVTIPPHGPGRTGQGKLNIQCNKRESVREIN
jgi:hypothetical protein